MKRILSGNTKARLSSKITVFLLAALFFFSVNGVSLKAQYSNIQLGFRGGVGMSTMTGFENNGLKLGLTGGICAQYNLDENQNLLTEFYYSTGGQLSETWNSNRDEQVKIYSKYNLHYLNIPIIYQYYFTDILGVEAGPDFRYCVSGSLKTKIGNDSWHKTEFGNNDYNPFDFGLILGVFTSNLFPQEDVFVSLRAYFGFLDVVKNIGSNKNVSVQVSIGYMIF